MAKAKVILFKETGKYYTEEEWRIPEGAIGPYDMDRSPNFRRIGNGAVLVESQEPWGYPHLFPGTPPSIEERLEALERRLQSTLEVNNLWDGS